LNTSSLARRLDADGALVDAAVADHRLFGLTCRLIPA
jgi:hypothetical protein